MTELDPYLEQALRCRDSGLYYPALAMALALPDICASLAGLPGGHKKRYTTWIKGAGFSLALHAEWVWRVRCAFLHDATPLLGSRRNQGRIELFQRWPDPVSTIGSEQGTTTLPVEDLISSLLDAAGRWAANNGPLITQKAQAGELIVISPRPGIGGQRLD